MGIRVRKMVAVGHLVHKYDEIICSIHQGGHPASHHDPPVGGPWWGSSALSLDAGELGSWDDGMTDGTAD